MKKPALKSTDPKQPDIDYNKITAIQLPASQVPTYNVARAIQNGVGNKFMIVTWGGLGDQVCAEPVIRWAQKVFKNVEFNLASEALPLFSHLSGFKDKFDLNRVRPIYEKYMVFRTIENPQHLLWQFASHCLTNAVDFCSICMFRATLPIEDKNVTLPDTQLDPMKDWSDSVAELRNAKRLVVVHAGKHWPSKTFPKKWWDEVLLQIRKAGHQPVLIGKDTDDNRSTVQVDTAGCLDLRNKTTLGELIWLCKNANVVLTNDSSPLHIASAGRANILFVASCKHPDYIMHWRKNDQGVNEWAWRMKNLGLDGTWNHMDFSPVQEEEVSVEFLPKSLSWDMILPPAESVLADVQKALEEQRE